MQANLITCKEVTVRYRYNPGGVHSVKDLLTHVTKPFQYKTILHQLSFSLSRGESMGVLGRNGSGKSTLLRLLAGIIQPHQGSCRVHGSIAPILALGVGLEPELTGYENIRLLLALYGVKLTTAKQDEVISFSGLDPSTLRQPVKTYSSGMMARLAFSLSFAHDCDLYIIDEVMAVGDMGFQVQCVEKIRALQAAGKSLLFVSHFPDEVERYCGQAILLDEGRLIDLGSSADVCAHYRQLFA